ncbi:MAG: acylneuraminate cytidylyltransferase family protein [Anaerolineae bacterium]|nr:acylneuraminate cytidylyltransferase family protein [Anaerolineae bacterium]
MTEILAIIPARGGSKGVPRKNIRLVAGRPLIAYSIAAAHGSQHITRTLVSTEDSEIADVARQLDCAVLMRPMEYAGDSTPMKAVVNHVVTTLRDTSAYEPDILVLLQPTTPLRTSAHIDGALNMLLNSPADAVVSIVPVPGHFNPEWQLTADADGQLQLYNGKTLDKIITRRQELTSTFIRNGAIYAVRTQSFIQNASLYGERCLGYVMSNAESINIDSEDELMLADQKLRARPQSS